MEKLKKLKKKIHEHSELIGLVLELTLCVGAIFMAVSGSLKKALSVYDKQKLKCVKNAGKTDLKIQKMNDRQKLRAARKNIK